MNKVIGYAVSIAGIAVMAVGMGMIKLSIELLDSIEPKFVIVAGIIGVIIGVVLAMNAESENSGKRKTKNKNSGHDEIPIYEGTGKNRKIVGYRKD